MRKVISMLLVVAMLTTIFCGDDTADSIGGHNDSRDRQSYSSRWIKSRIPITLKECHPKEWPIATSYWL